MSFKRVLKRKVHPERGQPEDRQHLSTLLHKHKDYSLRAKVNNARKEKIKNLARAAATKNPDEFYFKMENAQIEDGLTTYKDEEKAYSKEALLAMKEQDIGYVSLKRQQEEKKIEKMKASLHFLDASKPKERQHIIFVENESQRKSFNPMLKEKEVGDDDAEAETAKADKYKELVARMNKVKKVRDLENSLRQKKLKMTAPKGQKKVGNKWQKQRNK